MFFACKPLCPIPSGHENRQSPHFIYNCPMVIIAFAESFFILSVVIDRIDTSDPICQHSDNTVICTTDSAHGLLWHDSKIHPATTRGNKSRHYNVSCLSFHFLFEHYSVITNENSVNFHPSFHLALNSKNVSCETSIPFALSGNIVPQRHLLGGPSAWQPQTRTNQRPVVPTGGRAKTRMSSVI